MTSSFTALCCLLFGLGLLALSQGFKLRITNVKDTRSGDKRTLTAEFEADSKPEAQWWTSNEVTQEIQGSNLNYNRRTRKGKASVTMNKDEADYVNLSLGDLDSHVFVLTWKPAFYGQGMSKNIDLPTSTFTPGSDLAYTKGTTVQANIQMANSRSSSDVSSREKTIWVYGSYLDNASGKIVTGRDYFPFLKLTENRKATVMDIRVEFLTNKHVVNGHFKVVPFYEYLPYDSPVEMVEEVFHFVVHQRSNDGPYPNDFFSVDGESSYNTVYCSATANKLESLKIFKKVNGKKVPVQTAKTDEVFQYTAQAMAQLTGDTSGQYICEAKRQGAQPKQHVIRVS